MTKNKNQQRKAISPAVSVTDKIPLVSVIIPMYNAATFIPATLENLLYQTMQDFEVVIIDDCSTDNSVEVVESFALRFGGRLHIIKMSKNTGMPYLPRNVGINFARGKYLAFMDNDDLFTKTALEELSTLAEKYQADIVNMRSIYKVKDKGLDMAELLNPENQTNFTCYGWRFVNSKELLEVPDDIAERVKFLLNNKFHRATWASFIKKDFWIANQISFPHMPVSDDTAASFACICFAKKILSVPNKVYLWRERADSISRTKDDVGKFIHKWLSNIILGFKAFDETMSRLRFFSEHPEYRYAVLNWFFEKGINDAKKFSELYSQVHPALLHQIAQKEFLSDEAPLAAYLFNTVNVQRLQLIRLYTENNALKKSLAQR